MDRVSFELQGQVNNCWLLNCHDGILNSSDPSVDTVYPQIRRNPHWLKVNLYSQEKHSGNKSPLGCVSLKEAHVASCRSIRSCQARFVGATDQLAGSGSPQFPATRVADRRAALLWLRQGEAPAGRGSSRERPLPRPLLRIASTCLPASPSLPPCLPPARPAARCSQRG